MVGQTVNVTNGTASATINTNGLVSKNYYLKVSFNGDNEYEAGVGGCNVFLDSFLFNNLQYWSWKLYSGSTSGAINSPSVSSGTVNMGSRYLMVLEKFIPVRKNAFTLSFNVTSNYSLNRIFLGSYSYDESNDTYNRWGHNVKINSFMDSSQHLVQFKFSNGVCTLFVDGVSQSSTFDFSSFTGRFYLMFFSGKKDSLYVSNISFANE